jgi:hypothetical protein
MVDTTTTTLTELIVAEEIHAQIQEAIRPHSVAISGALFKDLAGTGSIVAAFPRWVSDDAAVEEPSEGTGLSAVALETEQESVIQCGQMGLARTLSRRAQHSTILAAQELLAFCEGDGARALALALDADACGLFVSATNNVGTSTEDLGLDDMAAAVGMLGVADSSIPGRKLFVLSSQQNSDLLVAYVASQASALASFMTPGTDDGRQSGSFMGIPIKFTSQTGTANLGADDVGALYADGSDPANAAHAAIAVASAMMPQAYADTDVLAGGDVDIAVVADWATGIVHPDRMVSITTDAPA